VAGDLATVQSQLLALQTSKRAAAEAEDYPGARGADYDIASLLEREVQLETALREEERREEEEVRKGSDRREAVAKGVMTLLALKEKAVDRCNFKVYHPHR